MEKDLFSLEKALGFNFRDKGLLKSALTHRSYKISHKEIDWEDNERLEFLGDSVLNLCISLLLFQKFKEDREGDLTQKRAYLVCKNTLVKVAQKLNLCDYIYLGKREEKLDKKSKENICARAMEALIGALFLEGGFEITFERVKKWFLPYFAKFRQKKIKDYKTQLQEFIQKHYNKKPEYEVLSVSGPSHNPEFEIAVKLNGEIITKAKGASKKSAEILGAKKALKLLKKRMISEGKKLDK
ncbi:MAG: ribonuclease III [Thermodesulfobacterium geofontis]|uniref:Ribonuclease 3 n=1 Tax=Thermodesulfobacterium geofontis TaxID=1295609 RepID=A0A2N7PNH5_9BACT|nr:MAG: ribonuclease III [Thermodesulfobacterium geofontis]PMP97983.1 MAG: ribonuclease III [Thermodesulfobacterium geofontis]